MPTDADWMDAARALKRRFDRVLLTTNEYEADIRGILERPDSPVASLRLEFQTRPPMKGVDITVVAAQGGGDRFSDVRTVTALDAFGTECTVSIGRRERGKRLDDDVITALTEIAYSAWRGESRDDKARIVSLLIPSGKELASRSVSERTRGWLAVHFGDLDRFKSVNDTKGQQEGDRVILELSALLDATCRPDAIALHRSGDEFVVVQPCRSPEDAIHLASRTMAAVTQHDFRIAPLTTSLSIGIALVRADQLLDFDLLERTAEKALKPAGQKQRGVARLAVREEDLPPIPSDADAELRAIALMRSGVLDAGPFGNPWLNYLSERVYEAATGDTERFDAGNRVNETLTWIKPTLTSGVRESARDVEHIAGRALFSEFDVLLATAHGIMRARGDARIEWHSGKLNIHADRARSLWRLTHEGGHQLADVAATAAIERDAVWNVGEPLGRETKERPTDARRAVLVNIGHQPLSVPRQFFSDVVTVDDRPTSGGGLPDFWAASVARVLAAVNQNPNIDAVYIAGHQQYGVETIARLEAVAAGKSDPEYLVYKTGLSRNDIDTATAQLKDKVRTVASGTELVEHLIPVTLARHVLLPQRVQADTTVRRLQRELRTEGMSLSVHEGIRVATVAEAYPIVVEMVRRAESEILFDQSGAPMREIVDFRVHLTSPGNERVPAFYTREEDSLEAYFQKQFCAEGGLFFDSFAEDGQLEAVLNHLVRCIAPERPIATRRAILVVRHRVKPEDIAPLGLVSVRMVPRFLPGRIRMSYSYTWRTVEALVGCPYSLYGSVRYAQRLTDEIRRRLVASPSGRLVELGDVSYIAHSLHLFVDGYGLRIARRIVADVSE